jgi:uncharacterized protein involved in outer membrane biogenesis
MKFLQDSIERKLSQLLGRRVSFERFNVSPLAGQVEAEGMTVAGDEANRPLLSVGRISAKISVAKALAGQIVIKSMEIERPLLNLSRLSDGSFDFPRPPKRPDAGGEEDKSDSWQLEAQSIRLIAGTIFLGESIATQKISGELKRSDSGINGVELLGSVDIPKCLAALPPKMPLPPMLSALKFDGLAQIEVRLEIDSAKEIHIREVKLRAGA